MIDLRKERLTLTREDVRRMLDCDRETLDGYIRHGHHGIKLEGYMVGGRWKTSEQAVYRWLEATTARATGAPVQLTTVKQERDAEDAATRFLREEGVLPAE